MGTLMRGHPLIREHFLSMVSYHPNGTCDEGNLSHGDTFSEILKCPLKTGLLYTKKVKHLVKGHLYTVKPLISEIPLHSEPPCMIRTPLYHSTSDQRTHLQSNLWLEDIYICSQPLIRDFLQTVKYIIWTHLLKLKLSSLNPKIYLVHFIRSRYSKNYLYIINQIMYNCDFKITYKVYTAM